MAPFRRKKSFAETSLFLKPGSELTIFPPGSARMAGGSLESFLLKIFSIFNKISLVLSLSILCYCLFHPTAIKAAQYGETRLAPVWMNLEQKLALDGVSGPEVSSLLAMLPPEPIQTPMGRKIRELYRGRFMPETKKKVSPTTWYKGVVTEANAQLCRDYIRKHQLAFQQAQTRYGVSPAIASALLFVETRLGKVLADVPENAFYILASMAVSDKISDISEWLPKLPNYTQHIDWLNENLRKRSQWAYDEVLALIKHMIRDKIPPSRLPSSIYGAVGLCQFMPSNIAIYSADGDGDGVIDLFNPADAIASLACYLAKHGWKAGISRAQQHKLLMTYNHSQVYANTILALSDLVEGRPPAKAVKAGKGKRRQ